MRLVALLLSSAVSCLLLRTGSMAADVRTHVYMLAFMNITRDRQDLSHLDEIFINSPNDKTAYIIKGFRTDVIPQEGFVSRDPAQPNNFVDVFDGYYHLEQESETSISYSGLSVVTSSTYSSGYDGDDVSVQATKSVDASTDGYFALPLTNTSTEFYLMCYTQVADAHSNYAIAANEDDTCIEIFHVNGSVETRIKFIALNTYQVYDSASAAEDCTGLRIKSTKPVSVYSGHECAQVPVSINFCDFMVSQMPPVDEWGQTFVIPPIVGRSQAAGYHVRVVAMADNTQVTWNGVRFPSTINRGVDFLEFNSSRSDEFGYLECSQPCLVSQFNRGYRAVPDDVQTDPFQTLIPSVKNFVCSLRFHTSNFIFVDQMFMFENYVSVVVPTANTNNVLHNGIAINPPWQVVTGSDYSITTLSIAHGSHRITTTSGCAKIMGFVFGHGVTKITGYGLPVGFRLSGSLVVNEQLTADLPDDPDANKCTSPFQTSRVSPGDALQTFYVRVTLETSLTETCASLAIAAMAQGVSDVTNHTNWLICTNILCTQGAVDTWVYDISMAESTYENNLLTKMTFRVRIWSGENETNLQRLVCRRQIEYFLNNFYDDLNRWLVPNQFSASCPVLSFVHPGVSVTLASENDMCVDV